MLIWGYIFGGAGVFALIVGIFSVLNGRMTRREISKLIVESGEKTELLITETRDLVIETRNMVDEWRNEGREEHKQILAEVRK